MSKENVLWGLIIFLLISLLSVAILMYVNYFRCTNEGRVWNHFWGTCEDTVVSGFWINEKYNTCSYYFPNGELFFSGFCYPTKKEAYCVEGSEIVPLKVEQQVACFRGCQFFDEDSNYSKFTKCIEYCEDRFYTGES